MIRERLSLLREEMKKEGMSAYIIPTSDFHDTEYVCAHFAARAYMSGFTGSAGTLVVLLDRAACWVDGRYYTQAGAQLRDSGIDMMKDGMAETPSIAQYIMNHLANNERVGFDGRVMSTTLSNMYKMTFKQKGIQIEDGYDLVDRIWTNRPALPQSKTFFLEDQYTGQSIASKLDCVRSKMREKGVSSHVIVKIDEIAWLLNFRADDIPYFPVALAYMIVTLDSVTIYMDATRLDSRTKAVWEREFHRGTCIRSNLSRCFPHRFASFSGS